jgi:hypothetical protein
MKKREADRPRYFTLEQSKKLLSKFQFRATGATLDFRWVEYADLSHIDTIECLSVEADVQRQ